jgi:hypothetical protein
MADNDNPIPRRNFLVGAGTAVAAGLTPTTADAQTATTAAAPTNPPVEGNLTLTLAEHALYRGGNRHVHSRR